MIPYKQLPRDGATVPMQEFAAPFVALEEDASENNVVSSLITLTDNTSTLEISTNGGPAAIKWIAQGNTNPSVVTAAGATADFDHVIPQNMMRRFAVPIERFVAQTSVVGVNKQYGLYGQVAIKTFGISSVYVTQY